MITVNLFYPLLAFIPALFNLAIVFYIFFYLPKGKTTEVFSYFLIALVFWQVQDIVVRICETEETTRFWDKMLCIGWISVAPLAFHFTCRFASVKALNRSLSIIALYFPFVVFLLLHVSSENLHFVHYEGWGWVNTPLPGSADAYLRYTMGGLVFLGLFILFRHAYKVRKHKEKKIQALLIAVGILIPATQGIITQIIFPLALSKPEIPITSSFMTVFSVATIIALSKYKLFNLAESIRVETVLESLKNIVLIISPEGKTLYMNPYARQLFDMQNKDVTTFLLKDSFPSTAAFNDFVKEMIVPSLQGKTTRNHTVTLHTPNGSSIDILVSSNQIVNNKYVQGILLVGNDITDQLKTLQALKESNERYDLISRSTNDMVWDWNLETGEIYRNKEGWRKIFDGPLENEIGTETDWQERIHPDDVDKVEYIRQQIEKRSIGDSFELEFRVIKHDGAIAHVLDRGYLVRDENGKPVRMIGATQDITSRKETEMQLKEEQVRKHKEITDAVISAQENERQKIGAELHDNVNQILASASLYLNLADSDAANSRLFIKKTDAIINSAIQEIRKLSHSLIPPSLSEETLVEALDNLVETAERSGTITIRRNIKNFDETIVPDKLKLTIYRIVQEQFNNIAKYAKAKTVYLKLQQQNGEILLSIKDDGIGFDTTKKAKGVGLMNIKTRTSLHNGRMKIISSVGAGCILLVHFPASSEVLAEYGC